MKKRILSIIMVLSMCLSMLPTAAFAAEDTGLCEHHPEHTEECGYKEAVAGADCTHEHTAECYTLGVLPDEDTDSNNAYELGDDTEQVNTLACPHVHDEDCGYVEAVEASPCTYECALCALTEITAWSWIDEWEIIDPDTGVVALLGASERTPAYFDDIVSMLPVEITATVEGGEEIVALDGWACPGYPEEGAYSGSYIFTAALPEEYVLGLGTLELAVTVELGGAAVYAETVTHNGLTISGGTAGTDFTFNQEVLQDTGVLSDSNSTKQEGITILDSTPLTLSGTLESSGDYTGIYIPKGVTAYLTLNGATIGGGYNTAPITVEGTLHLTLTGTNTIKPPEVRPVGGTTYTKTAGIWVLEAGKLFIDGEGSLDITTDVGSAAIGQTQYASSSAFVGAGGTYSGANPAGSITINGGTLNITAYGTAGGATSAVLGGAAIGAAGGGDFTNITINGGVINATSAHGAAIGTGAEQYYSSGKIVINGGTVNATGGTINWAGSELVADGIGGTVQIDGVTINGGSVKTNRVENNRPTDGTNSLYMATVTLDSVTSQTAVTEMKYYINGTEKTYGEGNIYAYTDMKTDTSGNLYFWLPEDAIISSVTAGETTYYGSLWVTDDDAASETFITGNPLSVSAEENTNAAVTFFTGNTAAPGAKVYIKVTIHGQNAFESIKVNGSDTLTVTSEGNGIYSFTMPNEAAVISVTTVAVDVPEEIYLDYGDVTFAYDSTGSARKITYTTQDGTEKTVTAPADFVYTITQTAGTETAYTIKVDGWDTPADGKPLLLTINGLNINVAEDKSAIDLNSSTVELTLSGASNITSAVGQNNALVGVDGDSTLTFTEKSGDGSLTVKTPASFFGAAIGGDGSNLSTDTNACGTINIKGGAITATTNYYGAAIGSGQFGTGGAVTISGGTVTAITKYSDVAGAAIGGGRGSNGVVVTILGGTVTATSNGGGAAIGAGALTNSKGASAVVNITGGTVTATANSGNNGGAAIGSGYSNKTSYPSSATVKISGGSITATGTFYARAIGGGRGSGASAEITISGGNINIDKDTMDSTVEMGAGYDSDSGTITITGGSIYGQINNNTENVNSVFLRTIDLSEPVLGANQEVKAGDIEITVNGSDYFYGWHDVRTNQDGKVYLWLPSGNADAVVGDYEYAGTGSSLERVIDISEVTVADIEPQTYNGSQFKPRPTVTYGDTTLTPVTHYMFEWSNNINAGTATITIIGKANYTGTTTRTFVINPKALTEDMVTLSETIGTYTGSALTPTVTVADGTALTADDYTAAWEPSEVKDAGTYTLTVTGQKNYTGTVTKTFTVNRADPMVSAVPSAVSDLVYDGSEQKLISAGVVAGGELQYSLDGTNYSAAIPKATDASSYTVYYKVVGDKNHNDTQPAQIAVSIDKANASDAMKTATGSLVKGGTSTVTLPALPTDASYGAPTANSSEITGVTLNNGVLTITGGDGVTDGGNYTIAVPVTGAKNYENYTITVTLTGTNKQAQTIAVDKESITATYGDSGLKLTAETSGDGTISYTVTGDAISVDTNGNITINKAGTATVTVTAAETATYAEATRDIAITINRKAVTVTAPTLTAKVGDAKPALSISDCTVDGLIDGDTLDSIGANATISYQSEPDMNTAATTVIVVTGATETTNYTIAYTDGTLTVSDHVHAWTYTADDMVNTITASCGASGCPLTENKATITISAPAAREYNNGSPIEAVVIVSPEGALTAPTATYTGTGVDSSGRPTQAGEVTATIALENATASVTYQIAKAAPTVTPPTANTLTYSGEAQELVTAGSTGHGTMVYSLTEDGTYSESIPTGTNAGEYTIWYKVLGDSNHNDSDPVSVSVTIGKLDIGSATVTLGGNLTYNGGEQTMAVSAVKVGELTLSTSDYTVSNNTGTDAGNYTLTVTAAENSNFAGTATQSWSIAQAELTIRAADQIISTGGSIDQNKYLVTGLVSGHTVSSITLTASDSTITASGAAVSDGVNDVTNNYIIHYESGILTTTEKTIVTITPSIPTLTYDGTDQSGKITATADVEGLTFTYSFSATPTNAGEYTVTISVADDNENYAGTTTASFTIGKKALTLTANNKTVTVNGSAPTYDYTAGALATGDSITTGPAVDCPTANLAKTGSYPITINVSGVVIERSGVDVTANYEITGKNGTLTVKSSGGGGGGGGGGGYTPPSSSVTVPISGDDNTIHVDAKVSGDKATVDHVDLNKLDTVIGDHVDTGTVTIDFSGLNSSKPITTVEIPSNVVKEIAAAVSDPNNDAHSFEVILSDGTSIEFDAVALGKKAAQADGLDITISIEHHEDAKLTSAQKNAVGNRPAYDINVTSGGEHISDMGGQITVHAPYELKAGEKARGIVVWYVDDHGNRERCETSYDPVKKRVNWKTDHLSLYMIDYDEALAELCDGGEGCPSAKFIDIDPNAWYHEALDYAIENGLMDGYGNDYFGPNDNLSRGMLAQILYTMENRPTVIGDMPFTDVADGKYYVDAIKWAQQNGIVGGYGGGLFGPDDPITREQLATILWRYAKYKGYDVSVGESTNILSYEDAFTISEYAIPAIQWACGDGVMQGSDGYLDPKGSATRAHVAQMLKNFLENIIK